MPPIIYFYGSIIHIFLLNSNDVINTYLQLA